MRSTSEGGGIAAVQKLSVISNFYEFIFNKDPQQMISLNPNQAYLHGYKVMVHPKMEKSAFLKQ